MISDTSKNVALTFEQLEQIETAKGILKNLEAETIIANRNLSVLQKEVIKATKEREYQEELIAKFSKEAEEKRTELAGVQESFRDTSVSLAKAKGEAETLESKAKDTRADLTKREEAVLKAEKDLSEARTALSKEKDALDLDRAAIERTQAAFKEAALTITWS